MGIGMRIGIFGGTFDPIHHGHIHAIAYAQQEANLDRVLVMVAGDPYHKEMSQVTAEQRYEWVRRACDEYFVDDASVIVDDREIKRKGPTYTIDTLRELKTELPGDSLVLIVGEDIPSQMSTWKESEAIKELAEIFVVPRTIFPTSSSEIRVLAAAKKPITGLLPAVIETEIIKKSLYNEPE
ncbi:MAG TPA: nicotinate-nicotinamide nucleotide adenylyltransferase [Acidimicrobiia bacterium]|nr:nicotinate-nicotinamide nucleotide adenylyltransferase [Acidimicrobiia bacterium]